MTEYLIVMAVLIGALNFWAIWKLETNLNEANKQIAKKLDSLGSEIWWRNRSNL